MKFIDKFEGKYAFLSNFSESFVFMDQYEYPTVEHAYQAAKTNDQEIRDKIRKTATPNQAKKMGRRVQIKKNWDYEKVSIMYWLLKDKFSIPEFRDKLLATGNDILIEGNWWGDTFWGVSNGKGENVLGQLLMLIRSEIKVNDS